MCRETVRVALLTPPGRGALAVVGVAGRAADEFVARLFTPQRGGPLGSRSDGAICFGRWTGTDAGPGEDLVIVRHGSHRVEIHSHGGLAACEAVMVSLEQLGAERQGWPEWLRDGGATEIEVEARAALARAGGAKAARILSRQLAGGLEAELMRVRGLLAAGHAAEAAAAIDRLTRASRVGMRLTRPWRVVLAGSVNAGKSSLVNAIAGHSRSLVTPEAGTTRDLLETRIVLDGWEIDIVDTAGLRDDAADGPPGGEVEIAGIALAIGAREGADLVLRVVDGRRPRESTTALATTHELLVLSKADLAGVDIANLPANTPWTSAVTGMGIELLAKRIVSRLVPEEADDPELLTGAVPFTERQTGTVEALRAALQSPRAG